MKMTKSEVEVLSRSEVFRRVIDQYRQDVIGRQLWPDLAEQDESAALRTIFLEGACFDFAAALSEMTDWPVFEIQWGTARTDDPTECEDSGYGIHRVVQHPSGRYLDASGWTDMQSVLVRVNGLDATYLWMGDVDPDGGTFDVDFELVRQAVILLLSQSSGLSKVLQDRLDRTLRDRPGNRPHHSNRPRGQSTVPWGGSRASI